MVGKQRFAHLLQGHHHNNTSQFGVLSIRRATGGRRHTMSNVLAYSGADELYDSVCAGYGAVHG